MRLRLIVVATVVLLLGAVVLVPRIIEAKRPKALAAESGPATIVASPAQGRRQDMTVGQSVRNDTSKPVREMKQLPVFRAKGEPNKNPKIQHVHKDAPDRVVQKTIAADEFTAA